MTGSLVTMLLVPTVSGFFGIVITMLRRARHPHFRAERGEHATGISIAPTELRAGSLPKPDLRLVLASAQTLESELLANWKRARRSETPVWIEPLR